MKAEVNKVIQSYLDFSGERTANDFDTLIKKTRETMEQNYDDNEAFYKLHYILRKLQEGLRVATRYGKIYAMVDDTEQDLDEYYQEKINGKDSDLGKLRERKKKKASSKDLGKLVDEGSVPPTGRADAYWKDKLKIIFKPDNSKVRTGANIPSTYHYDNWEFLKSHYQFKAIEFGNWLSQQDRKNYIAAFGLALFDFNQLIGFNLKQLSLNGKITVAFGARGKGSALAHFEPATFAINLTRYSRPRKGSHNKTGYDRTDLLTQGGGIGSYAHEFAHALDYYAGKVISPCKERAISGGDSTKVDFSSAKENKKDSKSINALMDNLLNSIIFNPKGEHSNYYERLLKARKTKYYYQRNELFARAFESYIHLKLTRKGYKNIFLAESKYESLIYLNTNETKAIEKSFDKLMNAFKQKI